MYMVEIVANNVALINITLVLSSTSTFQLNTVSLKCVERVALLKIVPIPVFVGAIVTLIGTGFIAETKADVCLASNLCLPAVCESEQTCHFAMPHPPGLECDIFLRFPLVSILSNSLPITIVAHQSISLFPSISFPQGGLTLTVVGKLFSKSWNYRCQFFQDSPSILALQISDSELTCVIPPQRPSNITVIIHPGGFSASFEYISASPLRLSPSEGPSAGGNNVIIEFSGKISSNSFALVRVSGGHTLGQCDLIHGTTMDSLQCQVPAAHVGNVVFEVSFDNGSGFLKIPLVYVYFAPLSLFTIHPSRVSLSVSSILTLTGSFALS
jgi:hypothetical protein